MKTFKVLLSHDDGTTWALLPETDFKRVKERICKIENCPESAILCIIEPSKPEEDEEIKVYLNGLDLGNNFTSDHFFKALGKYEGIDDIIQQISTCYDAYSIIHIESPIKFNYTVKDTFVIDEFIDMYNHQNQEA